MKSNELFEKIGENISEIRKEKGMKGEALAKELGVSKAAVSQMESGLINIKILTLSQIAFALQTNIFTLIEDDQSIESKFSDYKSNMEKHLRIINLLVCRIEYMNEQIECLKKELA